jgi:microcystin degradation protein MlrC
VIDAESLVGQFLDGGWHGLDGAGTRAREAAARATAEQREEQLRIAGILDKALGDADGQAALAVLLRMTLLRPEAPDELVNMPADQYAVVKAHRAGQNAIVFNILHLLRVARGADPHSGGDQ